MSTSKITLRNHGMAALAAVLLSALLLPQQSAPALAQRTEPWTELVNVSSSGGAIAPMIAVSESRSVYAAWWDVVDGTRYAGGVITNSTVAWSPSLIAPSINGGLDQSNPSKPVPVPPVNPRFMFGANDTGHLVYSTLDNDLFYARMVAGRFGSETEAATYAAYRQRHAATGLHGRQHIDAAGRHLFQPPRRRAVCGSGHHLAILSHRQAGRCSVERGKRRRPQCPTDLVSGA